MKVLCCVFVVTHMSVTTHACSQIKSSGKQETPTRMIFFRKKMLLAHTHTHTHTHTHIHTNKQTSKQTSTWRMQVKYIYLHTCDTVVASTTITIIAIIVVANTTIRNYCFVIDLIITIFSLHLTQCSRQHLEYCLTSVCIMTRFYTSHILFYRDPPSNTQGLLQHKQQYLEHQVLFRISLTEILNNTWLL